MFVNESYNLYLLNIPRWHFTGADGSQEPMCCRMCDGCVGKNYSTACVCVCVCAGPPSRRPTTGSRQKYSAAKTEVASESLPVAPFSRPALPARSVSLALYCGFEEIYDGSPTLRTATKLTYFGQ